MQINYLCPKHADWVYNNPEQALHVMARDEMQGTMLMQSGQFSEAIPYLGCAFDIAVILLEVDGGENNAMEALEHVIGCVRKEDQHLATPSAPSWPVNTGMNCTEPTVWNKASDNNFV